MTPERWQEVRKVLDSVLSLPPEQRAGYLDRSCSDDLTLRREVESLISSYDKAGSFLEPLAPASAGALSEQTDRWIGRFVGSWRVISKLGQGGMGIVYKADDTRLGRQVTLKFVREDLATDHQALERFKREARAASALNHPNICTIHEVGECEGRPFIAMELIDGQTLRTISAGALPWPKVAELGVQIVKALAAAHAVGIVHRDIKPENLMVRSDGYLKVLDFGLARLVRRLGDSTSGLRSTAEPDTNPGTLLGTVAYMSPEQVRGEELGSASDIFSLGVVLYELATGQHPFRSESHAATLHAILSRAPLAPSRLNPEVPPQAESLILRMLEKDARLRPSAAAVDQALVAASVSAFGAVTRTVLPASKRHTVGRAKERAELLAAFEEAAANRGLLVCVSGEPGIGKTTLVEDFLSDLQSGGWTFNLAKGQCSQRLAGAEGFLPFLEALETLVRSGVEGVGYKMRTLAPTWYSQLFPLSERDPADAQLPMQARATTHERVKRELGAFLEEVARPEPIVLFLDDLHWADASTVDLLGYLATKFDTTRILILGAYRPSDLHLSKHPFLAVKRDLQTRGTCRQIDVQFLSTEDVGRYLALEFPNNCFPRELAGVIHSKTEGNPLFMADLLRYLRDRKVIVKPEGRDWLVNKSLSEVSSDLPQSVKSMIEKKIEQVSDRDREVLAAAAVEGYEFDSAAVARAMQADGLEIEERLKALDHVHAFAKRIAEEEFPDRTLTVRYRFVHVLYQNELFASLSPARRMALSAALARALEGFFGEKTSSIASQLGFLYETARDFARASDYFRVAAQNAARIFANEEAIQLSRRGLELLMKLPDGPERTRKELDLQLTLAFAVQIVRGYAAQETLENMTRARELCNELGDTAQLFPVMFGLWTHYVCKSHLKSAQDIGEHLLGIARTANDAVLLIGAHTALGIALHHQGDMLSARRHFEESSRHHDPAKHNDYWQFYRTLDPGTYARSEAVRTLWLLGFPDQASRKLEEALALARAVSSPPSLAFGLTLGAFHHQNLRQPEKTKEIAETCIALCNEQGIAEERAWVQCPYGWAMVEQGQVEEGISQIRASLELQVSIGAEVAHPQFRAMLAEACLHAGRVEEALSAVDAGFDASIRHGDTYYDAELWRLRGELVRMQGKMDEAVSCFEKGIEIARGQAMKSFELRAATSLARLWLRQGKRSEAQHLLGEIYAWFTEGFETADLRDAASLLKELTPG